MTTDYTKKINERLQAAFDEVLVSGQRLVSEACEDHAADLQGIFLRDKELAVSFGLTFGLDGAGRIEVQLSTSYVKERVREKTRAFVTPGQDVLPGVDESTLSVDLGDGKGMRSLDLKKAHARKARR